MPTTDRIDSCASRVFEAAWAFHDAAARPGSSTDALGALARLEEALGVLSASWYEVSADPAPRMLSDEQQAMRLATLRDIAERFATCARGCRQARHALAPLVESGETTDGPRPTSTSPTPATFPQPVRWVS
jgi:hypothetical protein